MRDQETQPELGKIFREETQGYAWSRALDFSRLQSDPSAIRERWDGRNLLSDGIWNICFPEMPAGVYAHHTTLETLVQIAANKEIWLRPVARQLGTGEMTTFAAQFGFDGYLREDAKGARIVDQLAEDLFALSLTDSAPRAVHWNGFGLVRLLLEVEPVQKRAELRRVEYADPGRLADHPLFVLDAIAKAKFNKPFNAWRTSRMGAFYLGFLFEDEAEVRLLIKREEGAPALPTKTTSSGEVLAVPLDSYYERVNIRLIGVQTQSNQLAAQVTAVLAAVPHWNVQVSVLP